MIRITHQKRITDKPSGLSPRMVYRTTVWVLWIVPVFVIEREI